MDGITVRQEVLDEHDEMTCDGLTNDHTKLYKSSNIKFFGSRNL